MSEASQVLCWPRRVLSAEDLRRHLNGQRALRLLPGTIITPLAMDDLRARKVQVAFEAAQPQAKQEQGAAWGYAQQREEALVGSAVDALRRDGLSFQAMDVGGELGEWVLRLAEQVARRQPLGAVVFSGDPGLVCCLANKVAGLRAAAALTVAQAERARRSLGANLLAVEMPGRSFFEIKQILRTAAMQAECPQALAATLGGLDGHAHR